MCGDEERKKKIKIKQAKKKEIELSFIAGVKKKLTCCAAHKTMSRPLTYFYIKHVLFIFKKNIFMHMEFFAKF